MCSTQRVKGTIRIVNKTCSFRGWWQGIAVVICWWTVVAPKGGQGLPIVNRNVSSSNVSKVVEFMSRYGYLPPPDPNSGNLQTEDQLRAAIAKMQLYANLPPTGLLDDATLRLAQRRRCGVPDMRPGELFRVRRYAIQGQKWIKTNLTWSVRSSLPAADLRTVQTQLRRAFAVWSSASALRFTEVAVDGISADIAVSFLSGPHGDGYPFDGEGAVLAHAFFPGDGIGGDAHFDAEEKWMESRPLDEDDGVHLFAVAAHEIGHSLGLSHSSTPGSLMFPYYQTVGEYFTLPQDDADGIRHLYGANEVESPSTLPSLPTTTVIPTTKTTSETTKTPHHTTTRATTSKATTDATTRVTTPKPPLPDVCNVSIDAISLIRRELFIFKDKYFWRFNLNRTLKAGYPAPIDRFWTDFTDVDHIDALYERPGDTKIIFFTGKKYWLYSGNQLETGYPRPLTDLGLPSNVDRIDAAIVWGHNGQTYFFSGKEYWKFDEDEKHVELDYPRSIDSWRGVPYDVDAAFKWVDGNTYFFKGRQFWKFIDSKMKIDGKDLPTVGEFWFKCDSENTTLPSLEPTTSTDDDRTNISRGNEVIAFKYLVLMAYVLGFVTRQNLV